MTLDFSALRSWAKTLNALEVLHNAAPNGGPLQAAHQVVERFKALRDDFQVRHFAMVLKRKPQGHRPESVPFGAEQQKAPGRKERSTRSVLLYPERSILSDGNW
jgi:hypothetical protein